MQARIQRILSGIEIFALVFWVGGLFFLTGIAAGVPAILPDMPRRDVWSVLDVLYRHFNRIEPFFAVVVIASNFFKVLVFGRFLTLQRAALMFSAIMCFLMITYSTILWPRIEEQRKETAVATPANRPAELKKLDELERDYINLMGANLICGLFLVYAYRAFEERKLQALAKVLNVEEVQR
jgi:uncharacterized membrane protein